MAVVYDAIPRDLSLPRANSGNANNRRRYARFAADGVAELLQRGPSINYMDGELKDLSELGCLVTTKSVILPGTDLKLVLRVANYDLSLKGQVRHAALDVGLGVEFREIRKGDRALLQQLIRKLAEKEKPAEPKPTKPKAKWAAMLG